MVIVRVSDQDRLYISMVALSQILRVEVPDPVGIRKYRSQGFLPKVRVRIERGCHDGIRAEANKESADPKVTNLNRTILITLGNVVGDS
ncbi:MAG: hypothetical protein ABI672_18705 [Vicinamibacteria bacterium]